MVSFKVKEANLSPNSASSEEGTKREREACNVEVECASIATAAVSFCDVGIC